MEKKIHELTLEEAIGIQKSRIAELERFENSAREVEIKIQKLQGIIEFLTSERNAQKLVEPPKEGEKILTMEQAKILAEKKRNEVAAIENTKRAEKEDTLKRWGRIKTFTKNGIVFKKRKCRKGE